MILPFSPETAVRYDCFNCCLEYLGPTFREEDELLFIVTLLSEEPLL